MQSSTSKGGKHAMRGPGHSADDPRRLWSNHIGNARLATVPSGSEIHSNEAATGRHSPPKELISGEKAPQMARWPATGDGLARSTCTSSPRSLRGPARGPTASSDARVRSWA